MRSPTSPRSRKLPPLVAAVTIGLCALGADASGALGAAASKPAAPKPSAAAGFTITKILAAPADTQSCDDLGFLDGNLFMGCQNATLSGGRWWYQHPGGGLACREGDPDLGDQRQDRRAGR